MYEHLHLGTDAANQIRSAAAALAEIDDITKTGSDREILYDVAHALSDLHEPINALLGDHPLTEHDEEFAADMRAAMDALKQAAQSFHHASDNL